MQRSRGWTLVELMIGMTIGLVIVSAGTFALTHQVQDHRRLLLEARMQQDLRAAADLVARHLRRAGHWAHADTGIWLRDTLQAADNPHRTTSGAEPNVASDRLDFSYAPRGDTAPTVDSSERYGLRLRHGGIEMQLGLHAGGAGNWQQLTDPATLTVTRFALTLRHHEIDLQRFCVRPCAASAACGPTQQVREIDIDIEAHAVHDPALRRSIHASVQPPNPVLGGACPA